MYCENCGNELNEYNICLCDKCGCKNKKHYKINEYKKAVKYINIFSIVVAFVMFVLLSFSIYGYIKSGKISDGLWEIIDALEGPYATISAESRSFRRLEIDVSISSINYEKCIIYFGIDILLLIIISITANMIYRKNQKSHNLQN